MVQQDIAGLTVKFKSPHELKQKLRETLVEIQEKREIFEKECRDLRKREKALKRFLENQGEPAANVHGDLKAF